MRDRAEPITDRWLTVDEVRLVSDLRIMHAKMHDIYQFVEELKQRYSIDEITRYADEKLLRRDIQQSDEIYQWYLDLKENVDRSRS